MKIISAFAANDLKNIWREYMLVYILFIPVLLILFIRFLLPPLSNWTMTSFGLRLADYYPVILSFFLVLEIPFLFGVLYGLLFLDEKDEHLITVLQVTPVSINSYLRYRFAVIVLLSVLFVAVGIPLTGAAPGLKVLPLLATAFLGGLNGVLLTLILIGFANDKVEGMALMKGFGILMLAPSGGFFAQSKLQLLLGIFPAYWPSKAFWLFSQGENGWLYLLIGVNYVSLLCFLLYKRFKSRIGFSI